MPEGETRSIRSRFVVFDGAHHLLGHWRRRRDDLNIHAEDQQQSGNQHRAAALPLGQPDGPDTERGQDCDDDKADKGWVQGARVPRN